jgi:hypothetical protein
MGDLKVFEFRWAKQGEKEWVCARTNIEALMHYLNTCSISINELDENDEVVEVPKDRWAEMVIYGEPNITFDQYMNGKDCPDIIAGTIC